MAARGAQKRAAVQRKLDRLNDRDDGWRYLTELAQSGNRSLEDLVLIKLDEWINDFGPPPEELVDFIRRVLFDPVAEHAGWAAEPARRLGRWKRRVAQLRAHTRRDVEACFRQLRQSLSKKSQKTKHSRHL
jgi:hypothetical protein